MRSFIVVALAFVFAAGLACYGGSPPSAAPSATVEAGLALTQSLACSSCHGADLSGSDTPIGAGGSLAYAANLTPDPDTGIGSWSDEQIARAIRTGVDDQGTSLCAAMPRFASLDDDQVASVVTYLRSLPPISHEVPESECTSPADLDDAGAGDAGVVIVTDDAPSCDGYAAPATPGGCHACSGATCQANGCFGGYFCDLTTSRCVPAPSGC